MKVIDNKLFIVENFIFPETCKFLIDSFSDSVKETSKPAVFAGPNADLTTDANMVSGINKISSDANNIAIDLFTSICTNIEKSVSNIFNKNLKFRSYFYSHMTAGAKNPPHVDNKIYKNDFSAILYLSEDYEGGEIHFPKIDVSLKPNSGTLIAFFGNLELGHEVKEVVNGNRVNIVCFLTEEYNVNNQ